MSIQEMGSKCKRVIERVPRDAFILAVLVLSASASFGLGYLTGRDQAIGQGSSSALTIEIAPAQPAAATVAAPTTAATPTASATVGSYVASKNGTKYYLPTCSGAKRISEANQVWFASAAAAAAAGYTPAANCKGL